MVDARRLKYTLMLVILVGSGLGLLASTQDWFSFSLVRAADHIGSVTVQGSAAAPALTALSLAGLALAAALAIAGPVIRIVLAILGILLGGCIILSTSVAIANPIQSATTAITGATGVAGGQSISRLVASTHGTIWPWVGVAGGVVLAVASLGVLVTTRRWPGASRRFQTVRFETAGDASEPPETADPSETAGASANEPVNARDAAIDSWDELSRGEDPTR